MVGKEQNCISVKILSSIPKRKNYEPGSIKFLPIDMIKHIFKVVILYYQY